MSEKNDTSRRSFIKKTALAGLATSMPFGIIRSANLDEEIIGHGDFRYRVERGWGDLDPSKTPVNNCHEMVMDSQGRLIMVTDHPKNNVIIYDKSGKLIEYLYFANLKAVGRLAPRIIYFTLF